MSEEELQDIEKKYGTRDKDFIIHLHGLEQLNAFVQKKKIIPLQYLKEAIIGDPEVARRLVELHEQSCEFRKKKDALQGVGLTDNASCMKLYHDTKRIDAHERKIENAYKEASKDYSVGTLTELLAYKKNRSKPLSNSFILKHLSKVEKNPKMKKIADRLAGKGILGKLDRLLPFRKQREQKFLNAVLASYKSSNVLPTLNIKKVDIDALEGKPIERIAKAINKQTARLRAEISDERTRIQASRVVITQKLDEYEAEQKKLRKEFMSLLATRTDFLPRMFQDQIWAESNLKDSLKIAACFKEEKDIIKSLNEMQGNSTVVTLNIDENAAGLEADKDVKIYEKKVA